VNKIIRCNPLWYIISVVLALFVVSISFAHPVWAIENEKIVKVGVYDNKPKIYRESNGKISGFFADIIDFIAIQENWKIEYVYGTWEEGLARLDKGDIDIMVDVATSPERVQKYDFTSETVLGSWGVVYVKKSSKVVSFKDLDNKKIAILRQSVYLEGEQGINQYIKSFNLNVTLIEKQQYPDVFTAVDTGEVDAAIVSRIFGATNEKNFPDLRATNIYFDPTEIKFALRKGNPNNTYLVQSLDYWLEKIRGGYKNFYQDSLNKYGLAGMTGYKEVIPGWVKIIAYILGGLLTLFVFIFILLRREREKVSRQLYQKELLLGNIVSNTPVYLASTDGNGVVTMFAGKGTGLIEFLPIKVIGRSAFDVFKASPLVVENLKKALAGESLDFKAIVAGRTWKIIITPVKNNGKITSTVATAFDYTEEEKLDKEKTEFIYLASHHLRTPSTEIKWCLQLLWPRISDSLRGKDLDMWNKVDDANNQIIDLAETLSACSWIDLSTFSPSADKINLMDMVAAQIIGNKDKIDKKHLKIETDLKDLVDIYQDTNKLKTILSSIITNAIIYSNDKGTIKIGAKISDHVLNISISDTGIGIPANEQSLIFKRLYRATNAIKQYATGVGLSLYISKSIVDKLGGKIWFESREGKGATFFMNIPVKI